MARGRQGFYLSYTALALLHYTPEVAATGNIWSINIDNEPAPPPDQGPPFSAHATRDLAYLPYQILGIVGSYFIVILFIGTLLLSFGQRARNRAQMAAETGKSMELKTYFNSPNPLGSPDRMAGKKSATASVADLARSPASDSIVSFDPNVIAADRERRAQEMEKLYAAVMVQEDTRSHQSSWTGSPPQYTHAAPGFRQVQDQQQQYNPRSPVKVIYPDDKSWPAGPLHTKSFSNASSSSAERPHSFISAKSSNSLSSKKLRKSIRSLKISAPIIDDNTDGARTPLSPRTYTDPGVPPDPPTARTVGTAFEESEWHDEDYEHYARNDRDQEQHDTNYDSTATLNRNKTSHNFSQPRRPDAPQPQSRSPNTTAAAGSLPFRQLHWNTPSSPYYPYQGQGPFSAGPTKTTFVEVRRDRLGAPLTGAITPYSAYMPFTPLTPVTPHLTTRAERRQREREERTIHGAITEEDRVRDEDELWDESY